MKVELESKACLCGCGLTYRGRVGKPAQYYSRTHDPAVGMDVGFQKPKRRPGRRPKKAKADFAPDGSEGDDGEPLADDDGGAGDLLELRHELAL
jgi:hypothetical protein